MAVWQVRTLWRLTALREILTKTQTSTRACGVYPQCSEHIVPLSDSRSLVPCGPCLPVVVRNFSSNNVSGCIASSGTSILTPKSLSVTVIRKKSKKRDKTKKTRQQDLDDDDEDIEDDDMTLEVGTDFRDIRAKVPSLRLESVLKAGLNMPRNKVETAFYDSKIRVNGRKLLKKAHQCHLGDEVDVIKGVSSTNPNNLYVSRLEILELAPVDEDDDKLVLKLRRFPNLLIERYDDYKDPEEEV